MGRAIDNLTEAMTAAQASRPHVGGFPHLAEVLRKAGVTRNIWSLPSAQSIFLTELGPVVMQGTSLVTGAADVPTFNEEAVIRALRVDQAGESTFPEFLESTWRAGIVRYDVDFKARDGNSSFGHAGEVEESTALCPFSLSGLNLVCP